MIGAMVLDAMTLLHREHTARRFLQVQFWHIVNVFNFPNVVGSERAGFHGCRINKDGSKRAGG